MTPRPFKVVAEVGCNHQGQMSLARQMIDFLAENGAHYVKFQKRNLDSLAHISQYQKPHPLPEHSHGATYFEHRKALEFQFDQHLELKSYCEKKGVGYACSVWDIQSALEISSLNPDYIKVPSARHNDHALLSALTESFQGSLHISLGMSDYESVDNLIGFLKAKNAMHRTVLYWCVSGYPVPVEQACLLEIHRLKKITKETALTIGYSGHHLGTFLDGLALALGAEWIERHFTFDNNWKGRDHAISLDRAEFKTLIENLNQAEQALQLKAQKNLDSEEEPARRLRSALEFRSIAKVGFFRRLCMKSSLKFRIRL